MNVDWKRIGLTRLASAGRQIRSLARRVIVPRVNVFRIVSLGSFLIAAAAWSDDKVPQSAKKVDFVRDIRPVLESRCYECHGQAKQRGGLRLDTAAGIKKGGASVRSSHVPKPKTVC